MSATPKLSVQALTKSYDGVPVPERVDLIDLLTHRLSHGEIGA